MRRIIITILVLITFSFVICNLSEYKIANLTNRQLSFDELPLEVQKYLSNPPDRIGDSYKMLVLIELSDSTRYTEETVGTFIGPWISYHKLIDKQKDISYRIDRGVPNPCVIFKNKLYISNTYSILGRKEYIIQAKYTEYQLK